MGIVPNEGDAGFADMAELDSGHLDMLQTPHQEVGVVSGGAVTAQGSPNMTVAVAAGVVRFGPLTVAVVAGNVTITAANATNPRFDLVVVNNAGTKSVTAGTATANPVFPAIPANSIVLATVYVPANDIAVNTNQIKDVRVYVPEDTGGAYRAFMRSTYR